MEGFLSGQPRSIVQLAGQASQQEKVEIVDLSHSLNAVGFAFPRPLFLDVGNQTAKEAIIRDGYELLETYLVARHLRPGDTAVDIGASVGYWTVLFAALVGAGGKATAVEPEPISMSVLKRNVVSNGFSPSVETVQKVAGARALQALHLDPNLFGDHRTWAEDGEARNCISVEGMDVDDLGLSNLRLLKVDTQGMELEILLGSEHTIARSPGLAILVEYYPHGLGKRGYRGEDLLGFLFDRGFSVSAVDRDNWRLLPVARGAKIDIASPLQAPTCANLWCVRNN